MKNINKMTAEEISDELRQYTELASDEWQESVDRLCSLVGYEYTYGESFNKALLIELRSQLKYIRKAAKIEEVTETQTYTTKKLIWND